MEEIARRAGVGVGTVYRRFASQDALIDELLRLALEELLAAAEHVLARTDGNGLEELLHARFDFHIGCVGVDGGKHPQAGVRPAAEADIQARIRPGSSWPADGYCGRASDPPGTCRSSRRS
jgi:AcrR family transcriptional regulator